MARIGGNSVSALDYSEEMQVLVQALAQVLVRVDVLVKEGA
jgi:hypothetical protein